MSVRLFGVPALPAALGAAGLIPFVLGAAAALGLVDLPMGDTLAGYPLILPGDGTHLLIAYGTVILSFMSGVIWGFATRATGRLAAGLYAASVLPALWAFFNTGSDVERLWNLGFGFAVLLPVDLLCRRRRLAPAWWLRLRVPLTLVVLGCLAVGIAA